MKNKSYRFDLWFLCDFTFTGWVGLGNWYNFLKNYVFPMFHVHKNNPIVFYLLYVIDYVNINACATYMIYLEVRE